jgi:hypothetical protein
LCLKPIFIVLNVTSYLMIYLFLVIAVLITRKINRMGLAQVGGGLGSISEKQAL